MKYTYLTFFLATFQYLYQAKFVKTDSETVEDSATPSKTSEAKDTGVDEEKEPKESKGKQLNRLKCPIIGLLAVVILVVIIRLMMG